jgi:hypothetical protein
MRWLVSLHPMTKSMATRKTVPVQRNTRTAITNQPTAYDHLHALLHTVRCIAQYEDVLCEIAHETKRSEELSPKLSHELSEILDKMPSDSYVSDLNAVRSVFVGTQPLAKPKLKKAAKSVASAKHLPPTKSHKRSSK